MAITRTGEEVTPEAVLDTLEDMDEKERKEREESEAKEKADAEAAEVKAKAEAEAAAKAKGTPAATPTATPSAGTDESLKLAWDIATDSVTESCPDLDDEDKAMIRAASGNSPAKFRELAKKQQAKIKAAKAGAPVKTQDQLKQELAGQIFDGTGAGGDAAVHQRPAAPSEEQKFQKAVRIGDSRGILRGIAETVKREKLLGGTEIVE